MSSNLTETQEDYLETIYEIILAKKGVKVKDIAQKMNVKNSSVTSALKTLEESGHINYEPYGVISLTDEGEALAKHLNDMHKNLKQFLVQVLKIDEESANDTACRMEHIMPKQTYKRFIQFIKFIKTSDKDKIEWLERFSDFIENDTLDIDCPSCVVDYINN